MARKRVVRKRKAHRRMRGSGIFGRIWEGIKTAVTKPSTWLAGASMIPSPLSMPLKIAGTVAGLAGHGRRRRRVGRRRLIGGAMYVGRGIPSTDPIA